MTPLPIRARVIAAGGWAFLARTLVGAAGFARTLILARLLRPEDFGAVGTATLVLLGVEALTGTGFDTALLQRQGDIEPFYDSAFAMQLVRGLILAAVVWVTAPLVAAFVAAPAVAAVLRAVSVVLVLRGLVNPGKLRVLRDLRYDTLFWWTLPEVFVSLALSIVLGFALRNVWALVIPMIAAQAVATVVSYVLARRAPRLSFHGARLRELVGYGKWVLGAQVMSFLSLQGDNAFVAKVLGIGPLGLYQVAFRIAELPVTGFTQVVNQVALPTLSALQAERARLRTWYVAAQGIVLIVHGAFVVLILLAGGPLVHLLLGARWMPIVPALKILVVAMWIRSIVDLSTTLFNAMGEPRFGYHIHLTRVAIMAVALYPLSRAMQGIPGVGMAVLLSLIGALLLCLKHLRHTLGRGLITDMRQVLLRRLRA